MSVNLQGAIDLGAQTIKSLILVNGVAAGALLTFYGNGGAGQVTVPAFKSALILFGLGVVAAVFCSVFAYLSQLVTATVASEKGQSGEIALRLVSIVLGVISATLFFSGVVASAFGIR